MRQVIKEFVQLCSISFPFPEPIYEFGALQVERQEGFADLRQFFKNQKYIGADMRSGPGVDVVLNLHSIQLPDESVGSVICLDTFEHVEYPWKAAEEIYRIIKPKGVFVVSSVMNFAIHSYPSDYWRFTPEAFKSLFSKFDRIIVEFSGQTNFPEHVFAIAFKGPVEESHLNSFQEKLRPWKRYWSNPWIRNLKDFVRPFVSPKMVAYYRRTRSAKLK